MNGLSLKFMTFNIEGLKSINNSIRKITNFLNFISKIKLDIISLTEFDISSTTTLQHISDILLSQNYILYTSSIEKRSAIFFSNKLTISEEHPISKFIESKSGSHNYIEDLTFSKDNFQFTFLSLYTPVHNRGNKFNVHKMDFLKELTEAVSVFKTHSPHGSLILAGDWNTLPYESINLPRKISEFHDKLVNLGLIDCFLVGKNRHRNKPYTNIATNGTKNRLDRFLFNFDILNCFKVSYKMLPKLNFSTHMPIYMTLKSLDTTSNQLPADEYTKKHTGIPKEFSQNKNMMDYIFEPTTIWEDNPSLTYDYYITSIHERTATLSKMMQFLPKERQYNHPNFSTHPNSQYADLSLNYQKLRLRFGKKQQQDAEMPHSTALEANSFYTELFSASNKMEIPEHVAIFEKFIEGINIEKLTVPEKRILATAFTESELLGCLTKLVSNGSSAPGFDAITYREWFLSWAQSKTLVVYLANEILRGNLKPHHNISKVLIRLIPKKNYDIHKPSINDLRPISLTNSMFRLINYSLTQRMMKPLNRIIPSNQQAFLHERNIHLNIATTKMIAQQMASKGVQELNIMLVDFSKAFDNLDHSYMTKILQLYNFPPSIINTIILQSSTSEAHLLNRNLILNQGFLMKKGVRQGLPFSPLIFILSIDILIKKLDGILNGIKIDNKDTTECIVSNSKLSDNKSFKLNSSSPSSITVKSLAFADDIAVFNSNKDDMRNSLQILSEFASFSNLRLNQRKTIIYTNHTASNIEALKEALPRDLQSVAIMDLATANPIYLGSPLIALDWENKLSILKKRVNKILFMDLNLFQRVVGINTYVYSTIFFHDQHDPIPSTLLAAFEKFIKQSLTKFLPHPLPSKRIDWHGLHRHGGYALLDLPTQLQGRRAYYIYLSTMNASYDFLTSHPYTFLVKQLLQTMTNILVRNAYFWNIMFEHILQVSSWPHRIPTYPGTQCYIPGTWHYFLSTITTLNYQAILSVENKFMRTRLQNTTIDTLLESCFTPTTVFIYYEHIRAQGRPDLLRKANQKFQNIFKKRKIPHWSFTLDGIGKASNIIPYLKAWYSVVLVKSVDPTLQTFNEATFPAVLQNPSTAFYERLNDKAPLALESFRHLSKKRHDHFPQLEKNISYWSKHLPDIIIEDWKRTLIRISHLHYSNHTNFNEVFEFSIGILTRCFYKTCMFCSSCDGGLYHTFFECPIAKYIHTYAAFTTIPLRQFVGHDHTYREYQQINQSIKFLIYCNKEFYKQSKTQNIRINLTPDVIIHMRNIFQHLQLNQF